MKVKVISRSTDEFTRERSQDLQVNDSLLPASVISLYCTYLCYSALSSEPRDYECNGLHNHSKAVSTGTLTLGLLTTVLSVVYSAVRAGSSSTVLSPPSSPRVAISRAMKELKGVIVHPHRVCEEEGHHYHVVYYSPPSVGLSWTLFKLLYKWLSM